jgi:hypothetical protein
MLTRLAYLAIINRRSSIYNSICTIEMSNLQQEEDITEKSFALYFYLYCLTPIARKILLQQ